MRLFDLGCLASFFTVLSVTTVAHGAQQQATPLKLNNQMVSVTGQARASTKFDVLAFYVPTSKYDNSQPESVCTFKEDAWSMGGNEKSVKIQVTVGADGKYSMQVPTAGVRGKCNYSLDSVFASVEDGDVYEALKFQSSASVKKLNDDLADVGGAGEIPALSSVGSLYCQFASEYNTGLCYKADGSLPDLANEISSSPASYTLDIKDVSELPEPKY
ncbi:hypothetical protein [Bdellovibrio sp. NC01]|uniref:hypothetical protein n=1 Tax=Bdellovibrio sp. NC01 TaxID=2220073 RepID=UPI001159A10D|nr:hypothetical protein [Bdellovibrio sp. NC01]